MRWGENSPIPGEGVRTGRGLLKYPLLIFGDLTWQEKAVSSELNSSQGKPLSGPQAAWGTTSDFRGIGGFQCSLAWVFSEGLKPTLTPPYQASESPEASTVGMMHSFDWASNRADREKRKAEEKRVGKGRSPHETRCPGSVWKVGCVWGFGERSEVVRTIMQPTWGKRGTIWLLLTTWCLRQQTDRGFGILHTIN